MTVRLSNERGVAIILTLLVTLAVSALALGAIMLTSSGTLTAKFNAKEAALNGLADAGLEIARDSINRNQTLVINLPDSAPWLTLAPVSVIKDASGAVIPGLTRTVYAGKTGGRTGGRATAGQYGSNFMSVLSVITDTRGAVAARRGLFTQESWSKFAVAINNWAGSAVYGCGESIQGPFHSNNALKLQSGCSSPKVVFTGPATVVQSSVSNQGSGDFRAGLTLNATAIPWPTAAQLATMRQYAQDSDAPNGDYDITGFTLGSVSPTVRIDFIPFDRNGDGTIQWDEGYMRVFWAQPAVGNDTATKYINAKRWMKLPTGVPGGVTTATDPNLATRNCAAVVGGNYRTAGDTLRLLGGAAGTAPARALLSAASRRCFLGGDPRLFTPLTGDTLTPDSTWINPPATPVGDWFGRWRPRRNGPAVGLPAKRPGDAGYLIPLGGNPNFKGVVYVTGDVAVSGQLRGRVSVVATGNIILADDLTYVTSPGTNCSETGDILGLIATGNIVISDNNVQTPFRVNNVYTGLFDETPGAESYHAFLLTLGNFYGEVPNLPGYTGPASPNIPNIAGEACSGAAAGCIRITGGMTLGNVDYWTYWPIGNSNSSGWAEAHTYDPCGASNPPPYFPTTGRYTKSRYYEIDPVWLNQVGIANYFTTLISK